MTTNPAADLQQCEVCGAYYEVTDPNVLKYYVHLHLKPEEVIDQLTVPALHEYLIAVIGEKWPDQLLLKYGDRRCSPGASPGYLFPRASPSKRVAFSIPLATSVGCLKPLRRLLAR